jgi:GT2 family glycosyltransferase
MNEMDLKISIIIPVRPGENPIRAIESLKNVNYPRNLMEVIKVSGWHPSRQRNMAVKNATGEIVYFLDDDSLVPPDTFMKIVSRFGEGGIDVIGGPSIPPSEDKFLQQCFASCFASPFGGFNIRHRHRRSGSFRGATERELISCNLAMRREVYINENGLNENLYPNEENEFLDRLHSKGYGLFYDPDIYVFRSMRIGFIDFFKQIFTYGRGRMDQTFINPVFIKIYHFVPLAFVLYLFSLPFCLLSNWLCNFYYFLPLFIYTILNLGFSLKVAIEKRAWRYGVLMPPVFFACHTAYGLGSLWGLIKKVFRIKRRVPSEEIKIEIIKL